MAAYRLLQQPSAMLRSLRIRGVIAQLWAGWVYLLGGRLHCSCSELYRSAEELNMNFTVGEMLGSNLLGALLLYGLGRGFGFILRWRNRPTLRASFAAVLAWATWLLMQMAGPIRTATLLYVPAAIIAGLFLLRHYRKIAAKDADDAIDEVFR